MKLYDCWYRGIPKAVQARIDGPNLVVPPYGRAGFLTKVFSGNTDGASFKSEAIGTPQKFERHRPASSTS